MYRNRVRYLIKKHDTYKCFEHDFGTDDVGINQKHFEELDHTYTGSTLCEICRKPVQFQHRKARLVVGRTTPVIICSICLGAQ